MGLKYSKPNDLWSGIQISHSGSVLFAIWNITGTTFVITWCNSRSLWSLVTFLLLKIEVFTSPPPSISLSHLSCLHHPFSIIHSKENIIGDDIKQVAGDTVCARCSYIPQNKHTFRTCQNILSLNEIVDIPQYCSVELAKYFVICDCQIWLLTFLWLSICKRTKYWRQY